MKSGVIVSQPLVCAHGYTDRLLLAPSGSGKGEGPGGEDRVGEEVTAIHLTS